jgi:hypothetical protein
MQALSETYSDPWDSWCPQGLLLEVQALRHKMLAEYVGKCATKIQKVFRGHLARRPKAVGSERMAAVVRGWGYERSCRRKKWLI